MKLYTYFSWLAKSTSKWLVGVHVAKGCFNVLAWFKCRFYFPSNYKMIHNKFKLYIPGKENQTVKSFHPLLWACLLSCLEHKAKLHLARTLFTLFYCFSRHNEAKNFKPVTLPGQEAAADYQVKLFVQELKKKFFLCSTLCIS